MNSGHLDMSFEQLEMNSGPGDELWTHVDSLWIPAATIFDVTSESKCTSNLTITVIITLNYIPNDLRQGEHENLRAKYCTEL